MATPDHAPHGRGYDTCVGEPYSAIGLTALPVTGITPTPRSLIYFNAENDYWNEQAQDVSDDLHDTKRTFSEQFIQVARLASLLCSSTSTAPGAL